MLDTRFPSGGIGILVHNKISRGAHVNSPQQSPGTESVMSFLGLSQLRRWSEHPVRPSL